MIVSLAGTSALGLYDRSLVVGNAGLGFLQGVSDRFLFAYVSKHYASDPERCKRTISRSISFIGWIDKLLYLAILFVGLPLLLHFWGGKWSGIVPLVPIVVLGVGVFGSLAFPTYPFLTSTRHIKFILQMSILALVITLVAGPILMGLFGLSGACWLVVVMWSGSFLWVFKAERILGQFKWFGSWLISSAAGIALYFFIRYFMATFTHSSI
jgi:O-antigen/teichoic acid export membrane protein